jgi:hypothetical protein
MPRSLWEDASKQQITSERIGKVILIVKGKDSVKPEERYEYSWSRGDKICGLGCSKEIMLMRAVPIVLERHPFLMYLTTRPMDYAVTVEMLLKK